MEFVSSFSRLLLEFSSVLTAPSFANLVVVLTGWTFARRRTVTAALVAAGVAGAPNSGWRWSNESAPPTRTDVSISPPTPHIRAWK